MESSFRIKSKRAWKVYHLQLSQNKTEAPNEANFFVINL